MKSSHHPVYAGIAILTMLMGCNLSAPTPTAAVPSDPPTQAAQIIPPTQTDTDQPAHTEAPTVIPPTTATLTATPGVPFVWPVSSINNPIYGIGIIGFPPGFEAYSNQYVSIDGVHTAAENTLTIINPAPATNFQMILQAKRVNPGRISLMDKASADDSCVTNQPWLSFSALGWSEAIMFIDTPCGPYGSTVFYALMPLDSEWMYRITIESHHPYSEIQSNVEGILKTVLFSRQQTKAGRSQ